MECVFCGVIHLEHVVIYGFTFECRQYSTEQSDRESTPKEILST